MYKHEAIVDPWVLHGVEYVRSQLELINTFVEEPSRRNLKPSDLPQAYGQRVVVTFPLLRSIHEVSRDVVFLATHDSVNSAYVLGRVLVERAVNYCFLLCGNDDDFNKWVRHSRQKSFRLQGGSAGDLSFQLAVDPPPDPSKVRELEEDIRLFTTKRGREIRAWTDLSLEERIRLTNENTPNFRLQALWLRGGVAGIYDLASQAAHGSLVGVAFTLFPIGNRSKTNDIGILLLACATILNAVLTALGIASKHDDIVKASISGLVELISKGVGIFRAKWRGGVPGFPTSLPQAVRLSQQ